MPNIFSNTWYNGKYDVTEIEFVNSYTTTGDENESWDASVAKDGSIMCYLKNTKLVVSTGSPVTVVEDRMFKVLTSLRKISGLNKVTSIGDYAFYYTPNIIDIDLIPENIKSIGIDAFRLSNVETVVDFSNVPSSSTIGVDATRNKRWSPESLSSISSVVIPKDVLLDVPNKDCQNLYNDVVFSLDSKGNAKMASDVACTSFSLYHTWNYLNRNSSAKYDNWKAWFDDTINKDGSLETARIESYNNEFFKSLVEKLNWTYVKVDYTDAASDFQMIVDRLAQGLPTQVAIKSIGAGYHAIVIVGCNVNTRKLAVLDSDAHPTNPILAWIAFEDLFNERGEADDELDRLHVVTYDVPYNVKGTTITSIVNKIREKLNDETLTMKPSEIAQGIDDACDVVGAQAFERGRNSQLDDMWETLQVGGTRTDYSWLFRFWDTDYIRPKYFIKPTAGQIGSMFQGSKIKKIESAYFDLSLASTESKGAYAVFNGCSELEEIEDVNLPACANYTGTFNKCYKLRKIAVVRCNTAQTFNAAFTGCGELVEVTFEGTLAKNGLNLLDCTKLNKASIESVIRILSTTTSGLYVQISKTAVNKAFETSPGAADGSTSTEWTNLKATKSNWNITLE